MRCRVRCGRRENRPSTALLALCLLGRRVLRNAAATTVAFWLVAVCRILLLMADFLLFSESLPLVLDFCGLVLPLFADDLGDLRIRKARMLSDYARLVMLSI